MNAPLAKIQMAEKTEAEKRKQKVYDVFYQWDSDMNGYIERGEFRGVLIKIGVSSSDIDTIFKQVDKNKDKKINYEEFFTWLYGEAEAGEKVMTYVERTTIPAEACKDFLAFMKELQEEAVIQRKDKNKKLDGKKKGEEWIPKYKKLRDLFNAMDTNRSGSISKSELQGAVRNLGRTEHAFQQGEGSLQSTEKKDHMFVHEDDMVTEIFNLLDTYDKKVDYSKSKVKDGVITFKEFQKAFNEANGLEDPEVKEDP